MNLKMPKNLGMLLLTIWLILFGLAPVLITVKTGASSIGCKYFMNCPCGPYSKSPASLPRTWTYRLDKK